MTSEPPIDADPPEGFARHFRRSPVTDAWEPLWSRRTERGLTLGLRVAAAHCNGRAMLHGGVTSALADNAMGLSCVAALGGRASLVTVHLSMDFLGAARAGAWVEVAGEAGKAGRTLAFASAVATADGDVIARGSGVFRVVPRADEAEPAGLPQT